MTLKETKTSDLLIASRTRRTDVDSNLSKSSCYFDRPSFNRFLQTVMFAIPSSGDWQQLLQKILFLRVHVRTLLFDICLTILAFQLVKTHSLIVHYGQYIFYVRVTCRQILLCVLLSLSSTFHVYTACNKVGINTLRELNVTILLVYSLYFMFFPEISH